MSENARDALRFGRLGNSTLHLCVDMQNLFAGDTPWHTPWMNRVLPNVLAIAGAHAAATLFTRFIPARSAAAAAGTWRRYYKHWAAVTLEQLAPGIVDLVPPLAELVPPAEVLDKATYGPWQDGALATRLDARDIDTLVVTGGETDVCVLGAVLGAVDRGYRVVLVSDALCSAEDATHDAIMALYRRRFDLQIETATTVQVLDAWR